LEVFATLSKKTHWCEISRYFLYFGTISVIFTVIAGFAAAYSVEHNEIVHLIMLRHQYIGLTVTTLAIVLSVWRYKMSELTGVAKQLFLILASVMCILLALGADLGGLMVYHYGTGVQAQFASPVPTVIQPASIAVSPAPSTVKTPVPTTEEEHDHHHHGSD
jgi:uncharacterized membrane protein